MNKTEEGNLQSCRFQYSERQGEKMFKQYVSPHVCFSDSSEHHEDFFLLFPHSFIVQGPKEQKKRGHESHNRII